MRLVAAHRILIRSFAAFSAGFGVWAVWRGAQGLQGGGVAIACGVGFVAVAAGCLVYLRKAPHLRR
ncbi:MAG TPA: hypothetical protein VEI02_16855 [Planctomycetota bacterium]|nr:hypothetical protein [Planctomycetota bacterium]